MINPVPSGALSRRPANAPKIPMYPNPKSVIAMLTIGRALTTSSMYHSIVNATTRIATSGKASMPLL